jgi:hypothetical protein
MVSRRKYDEAKVRERAATKRAVTAEAHLATLSSESDRLRADATASFRARADLLRRLTLADASHVKRAEEWEKDRRIMQAALDAVTAERDELAQDKAKRICCC